MGRPFVPVVLDAGVSMTVGSAQHHDRILVDTCATLWLEFVKEGGKLSDFSSRLTMAVGDAPCALTTGPKGIPVCEILVEEGMRTTRVVPLWWLIKQGCEQAWELGASWGPGLPRA